VRYRARLLVLGVLAVLVLAVSPAALGDGTTDQLVVPSSSSDCLGFVVETIAGAVNGCTPRPADVGFINTGYSAAANGSVVFMANDNTDPSSGDQGSIWLAKPDGSSVHVDDSTWDFDPTISYDGSKVTFARFDPTTWSSDIYTVNSDGSDLQLVVSGEGTNDLTLPSISPDGSTIAYWCGPAVYATSVGQGCGPLTDGSYRPSGVMRVNVDGTNPRMIVIGGGGALEPAGPSGMSWSPDGQWVALDGLLSVDLGNNEYTAQRQLFEYRTDGSDLFDNLDPTRQITHVTAPESPIFPQFSPNGSQLLYMQTVDDNGNQGNFTYMIEVDGTNRQEVPINYGEFIPTATPVAPPPLVDETHITVPSVETLDVGAATEDLDAVHLTVGTVSYEYSSTAGQNTVVSQNPSAGAVAHRTEKQGPPVNLVVSLGAPPTAPTASVNCVVPKMRGKSLKATKLAIAAAHCEVGTVKRAFSRTVKKGRVLSERPGAGKTLPDAAKVALTVSKGKRR
jgi:PASTA domain/WD40-like Beta Propeller Repeat